MDLGVYRPEYAAAIHEPFYLGFDSMSSQMEKGFLGLVFCSFC